MSESEGQYLDGGEPGEGGSDTTAQKPARKGRLRSRRTRWAAAGAAAVVVLGAGAAAAAIHHHEEEGRGEHKLAAGDHERSDDSREDSEGREGHEGRDGRHRDGERGARADDVRGPATNGAPAPLPSLSAADAVNKAATAVNDGKVESLAPVTEQGGGRAWRIVVLGPDGVRHAVTVDGTSGTLTGNTVLGG